MSDVIWLYQMASGWLVTVVASCVVLGFLYAGLYRFAQWYAREWLWRNLAGIQRATQSVGFGIVPPPRKDGFWTVVSYESYHVDALDLASTLLTAEKSSSMEVLRALPKKLQARG